MTQTKNSLDVSDTSESEHVQKRSDEARLEYWDESDSSCGKDNADKCAVAATKVQSLTAFYQFTSMAQ